MPRLVAEVAGAGRAVKLMGLTVLSNLAANQAEQLLQSASCEGCHDLVVQMLKVPDEQIRQTAAALAYNLSLRLPPPDESNDATELLCCLVELVVSESHAECLHRELLALGHMLLLGGAPAVQLAAAIGLDLGRLSSPPEQRTQELVAEMRQ